MGFPQKSQSSALRATPALPLDSFHRKAEVRFGYSNFSDDSALGTDDIMDEISSFQEGLYTPMNSHSPLIAAIYAGDTAEAQRLLVQADNINAYSLSGETALGAASRQGNLAVVNSLLSRGDIDLNAPTLQDEDQQGPSKTPLMLAIEGNHSDVALRLLEHPQLDLTYRDENMRTALMLAAIKGNVAVMKKILERGGNLGERDGQRRNAIALASMSGHPEMVRFLLSVGADANHAGDDGRNALALAQSFGHQAVVDILTAANRAS
jgi:ankyrin repeat protein